ncbi:hypothetical protein BX600DRAFT_438651 [Xylariales sp. PMI_506]|nr:hypothetical protein BX600DRAFT_438651 [Xylariales sp. PMI_506]
MWKQVVSFFLPVWGLATPLVTGSEQSKLVGSVADGEVLPSLDLNLKPVFSKSTPVSINITMRLHDLNSTRFKNGAPLLFLPLSDGLTPTARYDGKHDILASDDLGSLQLNYRDGEDPDPPRYWYPHRDPVGDITVRFTAPHRETDEQTPSGPRIDLRLDPGGGLIGQGTGFIPIPPPPGSNNTGKGPSEGGDDPDAEQWRVSLSWDLSDAPEGTRAASSFGDAPTTQAIGSLSKLVSHVLFAVGALQRYPPWPTSSASLGQDHEFSVYWLGTPPFDLNELIRTTQSLLGAVSSYFSNHEPLRVFLRKVYSGQGGTGATMSFIIEYNDRTPEELSAHALSFLVAHEAVHEFALMEPIADSAGDHWWYDEGVADYVSAVGSFTHGGWDKDEMLDSLNDIASAYYTSPCIDLSLEYVYEHVWENIHIMRIMYNRGAMYLMRLHGLIAEATNGLQGIDDVITGLFERRLAAEHHTISEFRDMVKALVGSEVEEAEYEALRRGDLIVPPAAGFAKLGLRMVRRDAEIFDLGFDSTSMRANKVTGLVAGSRAQLAGLQEGDEIVRSFMTWISADSLHNMMQVTVNREGQHKVIRFWPRSFEKAEAYMWISANTEATEL